MVKCSRSPKDVASVSLTCQRPRTRSSTTIWSLPAELLLHLFEGLHVRDMLSLRSTHPTIMSLIDSHLSVWRTCTFRDVWPNQLNIKHFEKASEHGNIESLIKLGVAYLYNEGLPGDFEGRRIVANGEKAADMFCQVEGLLSMPRNNSATTAAPFTYLFMRPPWAVTGACCKECVFNKMKLFASQNAETAANVEICIAKTLQLLDATESRQQQVLEHLNTASTHGSALARYLTWEHRYQYSPTSWRVERCVERQALCALRDIAAAGELSARLTLCRLYAAGQYGGSSKQQAVGYVRDLVQSAAVIDVRRVYSGTELTHSMRYILVDWLAEVASIKGFDSLTLHVAINVVDRFLRRHRVTRARLQLLGVAAMVLCSRLLGRDIITIREAAWLTDNTYKYEDVVRMMGEISSVLLGNFRMLTSLDYTVILGLAAHSDRLTQCLAEYLCELSLLHTELSQYSQSLMAAACQLLARLTLHKDFPWSNELKEITGFSLSDILPCVLHLHKKSFQEEALMDHRDVILRAVTLRYSDEQFMKVGTLPMLSASQLMSTLGVTSLPSTPSRHQQQSRIGADLMMDLIASPSRSSSKCLDRSFVEMEADREKAATPTYEFDDELAGFNESVASGYDADQEDEDVEDSRLASVAAAETLATSSHHLNSPSTSSQQGRDNRQVTDCVEGIEPLSAACWNLVQTTADYASDCETDNSAAAASSTVDNCLLAVGKRKGTSLMGSQVKAHRTAL